MGNKKTESSEEIQKTESFAEIQGNNEPVDDGRADIFVPRGYGKEDTNLYVGINGVGYNLPRGKTSRVPKEVAEEIRRSEQAYGEMLDAYDKLKETE